ncbi:uncharacterized protein [Mytilus edulis]|uniref:uncharacterized protein isoform X2 n=1 Tax=Mytilus edulis TaxID=6550 RepID=UPI0039F03997
MYKDVATRINLCDSHINILMFWKYHRTKGTGQHQYQKKKTLNIVFLAIVPVVVSGVLQTRDWKSINRTGIHTELKRYI